MEYSRRGARVLALGIKEFGQLDPQKVREIKREDVECNLVFAGFVIISCPMKPDSKSVIKELIQSSHKVLMITGDNPLTACHVAKELRFTRKTLLILTKKHEEMKWQWVSIDGETVFSTVDNPKKFMSSFDLCITGEGLQYLKEFDNQYMLKILPSLIVCARFAPKQKEFVITTLKHLGFCTLMCGDGTNDVGALKHANVGVSLLSNAPLKIKKSKEKDSVPSVASVEPPLGGSSRSRGVVSVGHDRQNLTPRERAIIKQRENLNKTQESLQKVLKEMDDDQVSVVKLGDASIAAPFTSKSSSIVCGKL